MDGTCKFLSLMFVCYFSFLLPYIQTACQHVVDHQAAHAATIQNLISMSNGTALLQFSSGLQYGYPYHTVLQRLELGCDSLLIASSDE
jgi:hypothetical protein